MKIVGTTLFVLLALSQQPALRHPSSETRKQSPETGTVASMARGLEAFTSQPNSSADANARLAISIWGDLNAMCRGGHGDRPETEYACCVRSKVDVLLNNMGYCYHMGDTWRKCGPRDKRTRSVGLTDCVR